jgi:hypothetical protein
MGRWIAYSLQDLADCVRQKRFDPGPEKERKGRREQRTRRFGHLGGPEMAPVGVARGEMRIAMGRRELSPVGGRRAQAVLGC